MVGSITALFLRGFRFKDFGEQLNFKTLTTPEFKVWLLSTPNYQDKMDAYQAGLAANKNGLGVYVVPEQGQWAWVAGVYSTQSEAEKILQQGNLPSDTKVNFYHIKSKQFKITKEAFVPSQQILTAVQNTYQTLLDLRTALTSNTFNTNLQLDLTTHYNQIKDATAALQSLNTSLRNQLLATIIYTANQNILSLQDIIYPNTNEQPSLSTVNTALLKTIFSLDNF